MVACKGVEIHHGGLDSTLPFKAPLLVISCLFGPVSVDVAARRAASIEGTTTGELKCLVERSDTKRGACLQGEMQNLQEVNSAMQQTMQEVKQLQKTAQRTK